MTVFVGKIVCMVYLNQTERNYTYPDFHSHNKSYCSDNVLINMNIDHCQSIFSIDILHNPYNNGPLSYRNTMHMSTLAACINMQSRIISIFEFIFCYFDTEHSHSISFNGADIARSSTTTRYTYITILPRDTHILPYLQMLPMLRLLSPLHDTRMPHRTLR